jgi:uncharacterized protein
MPYKFIFDLSKVPKLFFNDLATLSYQKGMHHRLIKNVQTINKKFRIEEITGLNLSEALILLEDLIDLQAINALEKEKFVQTKKRALFLPHCSRKYMDSQFCKAVFDSDIPSFTCEHCSVDCQVNNASTIAAKKGYDVYLLAGGSCIPKILKARQYDGVIGVACGDEIKMLGPLLSSMDIAYQAIPLIKNGCANTIFNLEILEKAL